MYQHSNRKWINSMTGKPKIVSNIKNKHNELLTDTKNKTNYTNVIKWY